MFYVCKKRDDGTFGVMDTEDGVVEYYTPQEIIKIASKFHVKIDGLHKKSNGKYSIKVLKPTNFEVVDEDNLCTGSVDNDGIIHDSEYYRNKYEDLSAQEISHLARDTALQLATVIMILTGKCYHGEILDLIDGIDCMGYDNIPIGNNYTMSIFFNPDCSYEKIYSDGFGIDLSRNGKFIDDSHFNSSFRDWKKDFKDYKYKSLFNL